MKKKHIYGPFLSKRPDNPVSKIISQYGSGDSKTKKRCEGLLAMPLVRINPELCRGLGSRSGAVHRSLQESSVSSI